MEPRKKYRKSKEKKVRVSNKKLKEKGKLRNDKIKRQYPCDTKEEKCKGKMQWESEGKMNIQITSIIETRIEY